MVIFRNKHSMSNRIKTLIILLIVSSALLFSASVIMWLPQVKAQKISVGETGVKNEYALGDEIFISKATLNVGNDSYEVQPIIYKPDGSANQESRILLNQTGKYTLEYSVDKDNVHYAQTKDFFVYDYLMSNSKTGEPVRYFHNEKYDIDGAQFAIKPEEKVVYNKILDMSHLTKDDLLIRLDAVPEEKSVGEARDLFLRFTDIYDENNYITVRVRRAPIIEDQDVSYITACHRGAPLSGYSAGLDFVFVDHVNYGSGVWNGLRGNWDNQHIEFYFDYAESTLYTLTLTLLENNTWIEEKIRVIDFIDDFKKDPWKGFTTGEVYFSMWAETYATPNVEKPYHGIILDFANEDLSTGVNEDGSLPFIRVSETCPAEIDFAEYENEKNIPDAMVGYKYKIFDYKINEIKGVDSSYVHVYYGYNTSSRYELALTDNCFVPMHQGNHTIVYTTVDRFGNKSDVLVNVYADKKQEGGFSISVPDYENYKKGTVGYEFNVVDRTKVETDGNYGSVNVKILAENKDKNVKLEIEDCSFLPEVGGKWTITYVAEDYIGRQGLFAYEADINVSDKVVFQEIVDFPHYLITNAKNIIPDITVIDYTNGKTVKKAERIFVKKGTKEMGDVVNNIFTPTMAGEYTVIYESKSSNNTVAQKEFNLRAVNVGFGKSTFCLADYFYSDKVVNTNAAEDNVSFVARENAVIDFIQPVDGRNFTFTFNVSGSLNKADEIVIDLTDTNNTSQKLQFHFIKGEKNDVFVKINDGRTSKLKNYKFGGGTDFNVSVKSGQFIVGSEIFKIESFLDGSAFTGFDSLKAYMTIYVNAEEGSGNTRLYVKELSGQNFNNVTEDIIDPRIIMSEENISRYELGERIKINRAEVIDIIDPFVEAKLTVLDPSNNPVKDIDGTIIKDADITREYYIDSSITGTFKILYTYADGSGNGSSRGKGPAFKIVSRTLPEITIGDHDSEVKLGSKITIAEAKVTSVSDKTNLYIFYQAPVGNLKELTKFTDGEKEGQYNYEFQPDQKGTYLIRYMAVDEWNNIRIADYKIKVS